MSKWFPIVIVIALIGWLVWKYKPGIKVTAAATTTPLAATPNIVIPKIISTDNVPISEQTPAQRAASVAADIQVATQAHAVAVSAATAKAQAAAATATVFPSVVPTPTPVPTVMQYTTVAMQVAAQGVSPTPANVQAALAYYQSIGVNVA